MLRVNMLHTFPALPSYVQFTKINLIVGVGEAYFSSIPWNSDYSIYYLVWKWTIFCEYLNGHHHMKDDIMKGQKRGIFWNL